MGTALDKVIAASNQRSAPAPVDPAAELVAAAQSCLEDLTILLSWDPDDDGDDDSKPSDGKGGGDTDDDYWSKKGRQKKPVPGKGKPKGKSSDDDEDEDDEDEDDPKAKAKKKAAAKKAQMSALAAGALIALSALAAPSEDYDWVEATSVPLSPSDMLLLAKGDSDGKAAEPYGDVAYADPGYRGKKRYPIDEKHIHAAIAYFSKPTNREEYTSSQVKSIWSRIKSAAKKFGVEMDDSKAVTATALLELAAPPSEGGLAMHHGPFSGSHSHAHVGSVVHSHAHHHNNDSAHRCGPSEMGW
jgi:hypothetical protein